MAELAIVVPMFLLIIGVTAELMIAMHNLLAMNDALNTAGSMNARGVSDYAIINGCERNIMDAGTVVKTAVCTLGAASSNTRENSRCINIWSFI